MDCRNVDVLHYGKNYAVTGEEHKRYLGIYRAKVVNNHEKKEGNTPPEKEGRIEVWVPVIMMDLEPDKSIYAYPVFGFASQSEDHPPTEDRDTPGRREDDEVLDDFGSFQVPPNKANLLVFFEDGDPNQCRYFPFGTDFIRCTTVQEVKNKCCPEKEFYLLKTPHGHRIFISDNNERIMLRTFRNFFVEVREEEDSKYVEIWAPKENATKPFGSDKGPIGEGFEAAEDKQGQPRENKDNNEDEQNEDNALFGGKGGQKGSWVNMGGQESTIKIKGGSGVHGTERKNDPDMKGDGGKGGVGGIDGTQESAGGGCEEVDQKGDPIPGFRGEWNSHKDKMYIQLETPDEYLLFMNEHEDDRFIKAQTSEKYRLELNEHEDKKYIQLETPDKYQIYMNTHPDDRFIKMLTSDLYRLEMNEHEDKRYFQVQTPENYAFYINCHEDDGFIRLITPSEHMLEISEKESYILAETAAGHKLRIDEQNQTIEISSGTTSHKLIFNMATGNALIEAPDNIKIKAPTVEIEAAVTINGSLTVNGTTDLGGGGAPIITSAGPAATASAL